MSWISFTLLTDAPAELRTRLIARGILQNVAGVEPARDGFEHVEVPNPIATSLGPPIVMDSRRVFLVKLTRAAKDDEEAGEPIYDAQGEPRSLLVRTKLGKWIAANSVSDPIVGFHSGQAVSYLARRVGTKFWATLATLGEWQ